MSRLKTYIVCGMLMVAAWIEGVVAYRINNTIYDTNSARVSYSDTSIRCNRWANSWLFWQVCDSWSKPWTSGVYHSQGKKWTYHSSLNHQRASVTIKFQGTDVWVYGPPAGQYAELPPDYKICLHESYHLSSRSQCYQTNTTEAYTASWAEDGPVLLFARGNLQDHEHRIVISVADPVDDLQGYSGIKFSHVVYTTKRPTPWPVEEDRWRYREVTIHDTHPLLSYSPQLSRGWFSEHSPWSAKVHTAEDGTTTSWHELVSFDEEPWDQWGVETKIKGGAVAIYGAPSAYINQDTLGFVCVRVNLGLCETVDLKTIYSNERYQTQHEPVLLWRNNALDPSHESHVLVRLAKAPGGGKSIFPFKSIVYYEEQEYSSPRPIVDGLVNFTVEHDNPTISYNPGRRCDGYNIFGECNSWFDPWSWREAGPRGSVLTYRSTLSQYRVREDPHITLSLWGSAVYLYGAPKAYAPRRFAPQHVCLNNACRVIDVEQAYLHVPHESLEPAGISEVSDQNATTQDLATSLSSPHPELEPVLIWSTTGLNHKIEHTLRLALAPLPSPEDAVMTFVKVVYTKVTYASRDRPDPPAPPPDRAYSAPLHPPYATGWSPLAHKLPPPFSLDPPPPVEPPYLAMISALLLAIFAAGLPRALKFWRSRTKETQPLLSDHPPAQNSLPGPWGYVPGSPPPRYPNATENLPSYSAVPTNGPNRRR